MELFGYVCSPLCKAKAESHGIEVPVYAGQKSVVERQHWRRVGGVAAAICAVVVAVVGVWFWYAWFGSRPRPVFSVRFTDPAYFGQSKLCATNQFVFLHGGTLARWDLKTKKQVWSRELVDRKQVEAEAAAELKDLEAASLRQAPMDRRAPPTLNKLIAFVQRSAEENLELQVRGQNIWVASSDKLVRYDWETGIPGKEIQLPNGFRRLIARGDELLLLEGGSLGQTAVTRINLVTGESRAESFEEPARPTIASAAKPPSLTSDAKSAGAAARGARGTPMAGLPVGTPGADGGRPLDPAKTAEQAQRLPLPARIALPAVLAANVNQERALAETRDEPARPPQSAMGRRETAERFSLIPAKDGFVQFSVQLLEARFVERKAMKEPPKKSVLDGNLTAGQTLDAANETLNDMQRSRGGDTVQEDESRYRVTVRLPGANDAADWTGEVIGPPALFPLATVNVLAAGKTITVLDKMNKKLWQSALSFSVARGASSLDEAGASFGLGPCVERGGALYVFDQGVLTAFDLATGNARWRLPSVGVVGLFFDDQGMMYVNTTTASPESLKYSRQIDITQKVRPAVHRIDPQVGKILWTTQSGGLVNYVSGKFIYTVESYQADDEEDPNPYATGLETPSHVRIKRLDPKTGRELWEHYQRRAPLDVRFEKNSIQLLFKKEVQVLKFLSL